jgi:hypothetical protein
MPCGYGCDICINDTKCLRCSQNSYLLDGKCLRECPLGYFLANSSCSLCYPSCKICNGPGKKDCLVCNKNFKYSEKMIECISECPDGTYFNHLLNACDLCDGIKCDQCIKEPYMCIKCSNSLALDTTTFSCKTCCNLNIKEKITPGDCCQCPLNFNGFCLNFNFTQNEKLNFLNLNSEIKSDRWSFLIFIFLFLVIIVFTISIIFFRSYKKFDQKFNSIEYSYLNSNDDNIHSNSF